MGAAVRPEINRHQRFVLGVYVTASPQRHRGHRDAGGNNGEFLGLPFPSWHSLCSLCLCGETQMPDRVRRDDEARLEKESGRARGVLAG